MLSSQIIKLISSLDLACGESEKLTRSLYRYALKLDGAKDLKKICCDLNIVEPVTKFKKTHIDNSYYTLSRLWRAVYSIYNSKKKCSRCLFCWNNLCHNEKYNIESKQNKLQNTKYNFLCNNFKWNYKSVCLEYNITYQDLIYTIDNEIVKKEDMLKIEKKEDCLNIPNQKIIDKIIASLIRCIRMVVRKRLSFIYNYHNLEPEDFIEDITISIRKSLIANDHIKDCGKLIAIAKNTLNHKVCNIISKYTAKKRNRLISSGNKDFKQIILSLDYSYDNESSSKENNLHSLMRTNGDNYSSLIPENLITEDLISHIKTKITKNERQFINISLGKDIPKDFLNAVFKIYGKEYDKLSPGATYRATLKYLKWNPNKITKFKKKIKKILSKM